MRKPAAHVIRTSCLVLFLTGVTVQPSAGYTLVDWMRTWPVSRPGAVPAPVIPAAAPAYPAPGYVAPAPSCGPPATTCAPPPSHHAPTTSAPALPGAAVTPAAPVGGVSYVHPVAGSAVPQVSYRTTWVRVPTTNYRPIVSYDPATGWPTTTMLPCTTYTWQVRRVPADGLGSRLLEPLRNLFAPVFAPSVPAVGVPVQAPVATPGWGAPTMPSGFVEAPGVPAYAAPPNAVPAVPYGTAVSPAPSPGWVPAGAPAPIMPAPPTGTGVPAGAVPADQPPRLSPNEAQGVQRLSPLPEIRSYVPLYPHTAPPAPPPVLNPSPPPAPSASPPPVSPVPDPDAGSRPQVPAAPSLYDPNGRTARVLPLSTRWPAAPIEWPERLLSENPMVTASGLSTPAELAPATDTGGWQAVRP